MKLTRRNPETGNASPLVVVIVGVVVVVCFTLAACVAVFIAVPEGANTGSLVAILIGNLAPTLGVLALLAKQQGTDEKVEAIETRTVGLANGTMDAKIRAGIADVLDPSLIDPTALQQIETDRAHRARASAAEPMH